MAETMRAAVLHDVHEIRIEERPVPVPGPGEVLVRVRSVGVCGSDVHYFEDGRIGDFVVTEPLVLGHEAGGVVAATGPGVSGLERGERVSLEPGVPCQACRQCLSGHYNLCPNMRFFATPPIDGAFCEYVVLPRAFVFGVPDQLSDDAAALLEPLSVGIWACRKGGVTAGSRVLVTGAGPIGLVTAQTARAFGAVEVTVADVNPHRLRAAAGLGATATLDVGDSRIGDAGIEPDVLLECSGAVAAIKDAIPTVARAGRVVLVGMGGAEIPLPLAAVQQRELTVTGTFRYANTWPTAVALAASGLVDLDSLVTGQFALADVEQALTSGMTDEASIKAIIRPGD